MGIEFSSEPIEVKQRTEAGLLIASTPSKRTFDLLSICDNHWINPTRLIDVLVYEGPTVTVDCGIILSANGKRLVIVAGAMPCTVAVSGDFGIPSNDFEPEYNLDEYARREFTLKH